MSCVGFELTNWISGARSRSRSAVVVAELRFSVVNFAVASFDWKRVSVGCCNLWLEDAGIHASAPAHRFSVPVFGFPPQYRSLPVSRYRDLWPDH